MQSQFPKIWTARLNLVKMSELLGIAAFHLDSGRPQQWRNAETFPMNDLNSLTAISRLHRLMAHEYARHP
jgi:hypothetical protein